MSTNFADHATASVLLSFLTTTILYQKGIWRQCWKKSLTFVDDNTSGSSTFSMHRLLRSLMFITHKVLHSMQKLFRLVSVYCTLSRYRSWQSHSKKFAFRRQKVVASLIGPSRWFCSTETVIKVCTFANLVQWISRFCFQCWYGWSSTVSDLLQSNIKCRSTTVYLLIISFISSLISFGLYILNITRYIPCLILSIFGSYCWLLQCIGAALCAVRPSWFFLNILCLRWNPKIHCVTLSYQHFLFIPSTCFQAVLFSFNVQRSWMTPGKSVKILIRSSYCSPMLNIRTVYLDYK